MGVHLLYRRFIDLPYRLAEYEFSVQHMPGKANVPADALSRTVRGQNSGEQEKVEVDGTETLDEVMTFYSVNAVGFEAD